MENAYKIIASDGREYGPVTLEELRHWCGEGRVGPGTLIWLAAESRWQTAATVDQLKWDLPSPPAIQGSNPSRSQPESETNAGGRTGLFSLDALRPAGFWIRLAAYFVDMLILGAMVQLLTMPWADAINPAQNNAFAELKKTSPDLQVLFQFWRLMLAIEIPAHFAYFVGFNGSWGASPGKLLLGLRIVDSDGGPLGYRRAFLRHCAEWLTQITFGLGFVLCAFDSQKRALHDRFARTRVVSIRPRDW